MKTVLVFLAFSVPAFAQTSESPEFYRERLSDFTTAKTIADKMTLDCQKVGGVLEQDCMTQGMNSINTSISRTLGDETDLKNEFSHLKTRVKSCYVFGGTSAECINKDIKKFMATLDASIAKANEHIGQLKGVDPVAKNQDQLDQIAKLDATIAAQDDQIKSLSKDFRTCRTPSSVVSTNAKKAAVPAKSSTDSNVVLPGQAAEKATTH